MASARESGGHKVVGGLPPLPELAQTSEPKFDVEKLFNESSDAVGERLQAAVAQQRLQEAGAKGLIIRNYFYLLKPESEGKVVMEDVNKEKAKFSTAESFDSFRNTLSWRYLLKKEFCNKVCGKGGYGLTPLSTITPNDDISALIVMRDASITTLSAPEKDGKRNIATWVRGNLEKNVRTGVLFDILHPSMVVDIFQTKETVDMGVLGTVIHEGFGRINSSSPPREEGKKRQ
jgi:hypothetical protein